MNQKVRHDQIRSVIISPHISEKTTDLNEKNQQITFKVRSDSNKTQIKKAVEKLFDVKVSSVKTLAVKGKTKRAGIRTGKTKSWKKAYITLAEGQDIDFMGADI